MYIHSQESLCIERYGPEGVRLWQGQDAESYDGIGRSRNESAVILTIRPMLTVSTNIVHYW